MASGSHFVTLDLPKGQYEGMLTVGMLNCTLAREQASQEALIFLGFCSPLGRVVMAGFP
jgi:hypothetical protein